MILVLVVGGGGTYCCESDGTNRTTVCVGGGGGLFTTGRDLFSVSEASFRSGCFSVFGGATKVTAGLGDSGFDTFFFAVVGGGGTNGCESPGGMNRTAAGVVGFCSIFEVFAPQRRGGTEVGYAAGLEEKPADPVAVALSG
jgi:hypothetical protein